MHRTNRYRRRKAADESDNWRRKEPEEYNLNQSRWLPNDNTSQWNNHWDQQPLTDTTPYPAKTEQESPWQAYSLQHQSPPVKEPVLAWTAYSENNRTPVEDTSYRPPVRKSIYRPYLRLDEIERRMTEGGDVFEGCLRLSRNKDDAYVTCNRLDSDIYIGGIFDRNRAMDGDFVAVELLDIDDIWRQRQEREQKKETRRKEQERTDDQPGEDPDASVTLEEEVELEDEQKPKYGGRVVGLLEKSPNTAYHGTIVKTRHADVKLEGPLKLAWFKPTDRRLPFFALKGNDIPEDLQENEEYYKTHLFSAKIRSWAATSHNPLGTILGNLGPISDFSTQKNAILTDYSIEMDAFSHQALDCLPKQLPWQIPSAEYQKRRDLRLKRIFTIDPRTAKDLDDAVHITELEDGFFEVGVHIADVTHFLKMGTALDNEAKARGTSTYFVDGVIPMLPPLLSEELCSLNPGVDRLAFSVIWKMDMTGRPVDTWYGKTIIRTCAKLAYQDAQVVIEGGELPSDVILFDGHDGAGIAYDIQLLQRLSVHMRKRRYENGSLSLNSVKLQFELDQFGAPVEVTAFEAKEANRLIEEFMLQANISVASKILSTFPEEALLRRHQDPTERRLNQFLRITEVLGLDFDGSTAGSLQDSFDRISNPHVRNVLLVLAIRTMQRAKYICSGKISIAKYRHYALNEPIYTHFTSPIRRYADVVVHRLLNAALSCKEEEVQCPYDRKIVQKISFLCNAKKDGAKNAQDTDSTVYLAKYLWQRERSTGPIYKKADVIVVSKDTFEVYIAEYGIERRIYLKGLPVQKYHFDKHTLALDIYWKRGEPVTMHNEEKIYAQERTPSDDFSDSDDEEEDRAIEDSLAGLLLQDTPAYDPDHTVNADDLIPPVILDSESCLQQLKMFSTIDVRLQVNMDRIPPIINIYPVNPF
ncbi:DIS3-like exonuclease 2 [Choanephora cucurbitarum]|uniref:DIS3-like exonuclease 2 n=1 Tax=Choanephora cucurbitarum TaxID=101091 RepID=A0A1C7N2W3_9FUNG|nr:DIS3-like exonuclease 2 [Choanephora cucurbitarum]